MRFLLVMSEKGEIMNKEILSLIACLSLTIGCSLADEGGKLDPIGTLILKEQIEFNPQGSVDFQSRETDSEGIPEIQDLILPTDSDTTGTTGL